MVLERAKAMKSGMGLGEVLPYGLISSEEQDTVIGLFHQGIGRGALPSG